MTRLNKKAFNLLKHEAEKNCGKDTFGQTQYKIYLQRLNRLELSDGAPLTTQGIKEITLDLLPDFKSNVLEQASKINRPPNKWWQRTKLFLVFSGVTAGGLYFVNLPYSFIRQPIARYAPILLLPSYVGMNYHYRQALNFSEQADQLLNDATTIADLELGAQQLQKARYHLDKFPIAILEPGHNSSYLFFFGGYRLTIDEFRSERKNMARTEAKLFQERNALKLLNESAEIINTAQKTYSTAKNTDEKFSILSKWETAIAQLEQIPSSTLAGRLIQSKLVTYRKNFEDATE
jgi:hypothetical protein